MKIIKLRLYNSYKDEINSVKSQICSVWVDFAAEATRWQLKDPMRMFV